MLSYATFYGVIVDKLWLKEVERGDTLFLNILVTSS